MLQFYLTMYFFSVIVVAAVLSMDRVKAATIQKLKEGVKNPEKRDSELYMQSMYYGFAFALTFIPVINTALVLLILTMYAINNR